MYVHWTHEKSCTKSWVGMSNFCADKNEWKNDWCYYRENMVD